LEITFGTDKVTSDIGSGIAVVGVLATIRSPIPIKLHLKALLITVALFRKTEGDCAKQARERRKRCDAENIAETSL
jgi:hypothetical protein